MNGLETILPFLRPIEHLLLDDSISEVMVNGSNRVFIEKAGFLQPVDGLALGEKALMVAVKNIARRLGDDISESKPILDSRLPDGSRVAVVIPPCSLAGVVLTIRKFNGRHLDIDASKSCSVRSSPSARRLPCSRHSRSTESGASASPGPYPSWRDSRPRSLRPSATAEYRAFWNTLDDPCQLGQTGTCALYELHPREWCRAALPGHTNEHRGFTKCHCAG
jgi:hypothetical protein